MSDKEKETGITENPHKESIESEQKEKGHGLTASVVIAMTASLVISALTGAGLSLWDSHRTLADFHRALFSYPVEAATFDEVPGDAISFSDDEMTGDNNGDGKADEGEAPDEGGGNSDETGSTSSDNDGSQEEDATDPDEYGHTIVSDNEGSDGISKAGAEDEIVKPEDVTPVIFDPLSDYPRPFEKVDESYFTDALFIGDSRMQGFGLWSGLPATYYCATGFAIYKYDTTLMVQTENGKVPIFSAIPYDAFTKIYIKVGLNELGYGSEENFENKYAELIAKLREYEPRAIIYIHAILPVTAEKSESDKAHNNPNIEVRNAALKEFAKKEKAYFLDAPKTLMTEDGSLRSEMTKDGIHLMPQYMKIWKDYLCNNAVVID